MNPLGVDIAKRTFAVALLREGKFKNKTFANTPQGFQALAEWLSGLEAGPVHVGLEATSTYGEALSEWLFAAGHRVSVINPAQIKAFGVSLGTRNKTDPDDARVIARFVQAQPPPAWIPLPSEVRQLREMVRRLDAVMGMREQETNRLETVVDPTVRRGIQEHIAFLDAQIKRLRDDIDDHIDQHPDLREQHALIQSIPGIGSLTASRMIGLLPPLTGFGSARQLAAYAGLTPARRESGHSIHGRSALSKRGPADVRKALYMPALVARNRNPIIHAFCQRLAQAGKTPMQQVGAAMRKLLHLIFGVVKSGRPFDPNYLPEG